MHSQVGTWERDIFIFSLSAGSAFAVPVSPISQFDVLAVTSAIHNPVLPAPLTPYSVLDMNWDVVNGPNQIKQSNLNHGGDWIAFVTETWGYPMNGDHPTSIYNYVPALYFGTVTLYDTGGYAVGYYDEYYCNSCNPQATFKANTMSSNRSTWYAQMYVH